MQERERRMTATGVSPQRGVRDAVFDMVAPTDWVTEYSQPSAMRFPPPAKCPFHYQRRALAWLVWREEDGYVPLEQEGSAFSETHLSEDILRCMGSRHHFFMYVSR